MEKQDLAMLQRSVTASDLSEVRNGAILNIMIPFLQGSSSIRLPPSPPPYWSYQRDIVMRATTHQEAMWGAAIGIAITKAVSKGFEITGDVPKRVRETRELLLKADGTKTGWVGFLSKHVRDFLTTDNGSFIEIVRASKGYGSKILGLRHLDSMRCTRTGDPRVPILYRGKRGDIHELRDHQVMFFSDMPDPSETYYGVGICAASRAYNAIYKLASIENYLREKVSGLRPLAIYIVNGLVDKQLQDAVVAAKEQEISRGITSYMGAVIIGLPTETPPELVTIPLAELPERFNRREEFDIAVLTYADALGLDPQELQPLSGQAMGAGAQSQVLHDKAMGKGIVSWVQQFTHHLNEYVVPGLTTFAFVERDYRDITQKVAISKQRVDVSQARITAEITTPAQEMQLLIDDDELPKEFLNLIKSDQTSHESLSDTEKPGASQDENAKPGDLFDPKKVEEERAKRQQGAGGAPEEGGDFNPLEGLTTAQVQKRQMAQAIATGQANSIGNSNDKKSDEDDEKDSPDRVSSDEPKEEEDSQAGDGDDADAPERVSDDEPKESEDAEKTNDEAPKKKKTKTKALTQPPPEKIDEAKRQIEVLKDEVEVNGVKYPDFIIRPKKPKK